MLENLRRKSLVQPYDNLRHKVHFEKGLAKYKNYVEVDVCNQRLSKKEAKSSFSKVIDTIPWLRSNMIYCPKGTFKMGHKDQDDNKPKKKKIDRDFLLGETEVTQELYQAVMGDNPSRFQNNSQNPVERVSWDMSILFCNELSKLQGLELCYTKNSDKKYDWACDFSKNGYRLPTEQEWEYAAKAGTNNQWAGTDNKDDVGNYAVYWDNSKIGDKEQTHPVKTKKPNEWGFYDMAGNVHEWCWDKYDPDDPSSWADRVLRGGNWNYAASSLRSALRHDDSPDSRDDTLGSLGFRVCRTLV